jgi:hypothetical protein
LTLCHSTRSSGCANEPVVALSNTRTAQVVTALTAVLAAECVFPD